MQERDAADRKRYEEAATAAKEPSEAEKQKEGERKAYFDWKAKGDYRTPPPSLIALNYSDPAERQRQREMILNDPGSGIFGMGAENANPTALAQQKANMKDEFDRDSAESYQADIRGEDSYQRTGNSNVLMNQDFARSMGLLSSASSMSQNSAQNRIQTQPQSILPGLLSAGIGAAGMFLGGPAFAGMLSGGGKAASPSDPRLKENVRRLDSLQAVVFEWNKTAAQFGCTPGASAVGLLADEVERVLPQFVSDIGDGYKGVDYMGLSAYLLQVVKKQNLRLAENL
jgi:hypothetical protein